MGWLFVSNSDHSIVEEGMTHAIVLNTLSLKVERENALAMIQGFEKGGRTYHVAIFTAHQDAWSLKKNFRHVPKLITPKRSPPRAEFPLSALGNRLPLWRYHHKLRYAAVLDHIFHVRNDAGMWEELCSNGVFDIWDPEAPYNSLAGKQDPMILLLRVHELDREVRIDLGMGADKVLDLYASIVGPVVTDHAFAEITEKVEKAVRSRLRYVEKLAGSRRR